MIKHETQLVIFDMDGLLIDSEPLWRRAETSVMLSYGIDLKDEDCELVMGLKINEVAQRWIVQFGLKMLTEDELVNNIIGEVLLLMRSETSLLPGVEKVMQYYRSKGIKMCIASSSYLVLIEAIVKKFDLEKYIDKVFSGEFEKLGKPHPAIFLTAAKHYNIPCGNCLVFEDSVNGVKAAKAAEMYCVAVPCFEQCEFKEFENADLKLKSLLDLPEYI